MKTFSNNYTLCNSIPINQVLDTLGIQYKKERSSHYVLYEQHGQPSGNSCSRGTLTSGRKINISGNFVCDFSGHGRPAGGPFSFVKSFLGLTGRETFIWFAENFNINDDSTPVIKKKTKLFYSMYGSIDD